MTDPQHMDPDEFSPRYDVSLAPTDTPGTLRLTFAAADGEQVVTATKEQFLRLAGFILSVLPPEGADAGEAMLKGLVGEEGL